MHGVELNQVKSDSLCFLCGLRLLTYSYYYELDKELLRGHNCCSESIASIILMVLPSYQPVTAQGMNYAGVIFGAVLLIITILGTFHDEGSMKVQLKE